MISMASLDLPEKAMRQQIASAIDVVVQVSRLSDGTRKILQISEVVGMEGDVVTMQDIFQFERTGLDEQERVIGQFRPTGIRPKFSDRLRQYGVELSSVLFSQVGAKPTERGRW
jgi:pilus assembly protein CpaF